MDKTSAFALATHLRGQLADVPDVRDVQPQMLNPLNGDAGLGWGVRIYRLDGDLDVFGTERGGYQTMQGTGKPVTLDRLIAEQIAKAPTGEVSPPEDDDLVSRLTRLAVAAEKVAREAMDLRDEWALRANR